MPLLRTEDRGERGNHPIGAATALRVLRRYVRNQCAEGDGQDQGCSGTGRTGTAAARRLGRRLGQPIVIAAAF